MADRRAFTLIELLAVVVLLGLLAGATAWSMTGELRRANQEDVVGELRYLDQSARLGAIRRGHRCALIFDFGQQQVRRIIDPGGNDEEIAGRYAIPQGLEIDRLLVAELVDGRGERDQRTEPRTVSGGTATIAFGQGGRGTSYAARLSNKDGSTWLVFAGLTGQMTRVNDGGTVDKLFSTLRRGGADAD